MKTSDPAHYRKMCEPFETIDKANEQLVAFFEAVKRARDEHHIADVVVLVDVPVVRDGDEVRCDSFAAYGDSARVLPMLAREFGAEQARHEARIAHLVAQARKTSK